MNYRHIYHAGNFADVLKHAVLARLVTYMQAKDKAFRVLDTHAGLGLYDLSSEEAQKTGEWRDGIGRLLDGELPAEMAELLAPYLETVKALNPDGGVRLYRCQGWVAADGAEIDLATARVTMTNVKGSLPVGNALKKP